MAQYIDFLLSMEGEMSFGLQVNDYSKVSEGAYGYTIKLNIADYKPDISGFVQATSQPLSVDAPVTEGVSLAVLQTYPDLEACPDMAFSWRAETLEIFFKESVYPYADDDVRFAFEGLRYPMVAQDDTSYIDVPDEHIDFLRDKSREIAWELKKNMVDKDLLKAIKDKTFEIQTS